MDCLELRIPPLPQFITVGHSVWLPGMQHFERRFDVYDLLIVARGAFYMTEEGAPFELNTGGILLLEPGKKHWGHLPVKEETEIYWLHFSHPPALRRVQHDQIPWSSPLRKGTDFDTVPPPQTMYLPKFAHLNIKPIVPVLDEMSGIFAESSLRNALRLHALTIDLLQRLQALAGSSVSGRSYTISERVIDYLNRNAEGSFDAAAMESELHFHADYLARCLKQYTGMSPQQYFTHIKLDRARMLLTGTDDSVQEIADRTGFGSANYLIRLFRQHFGVTPGRYRSQYKERV